MAEDIKMKTHKVLDKNIVFGTILILLLGVIVSSVFTEVLMAGFAAAGITDRAVKLLLTGLGGIAALLVFRLVFKGEFLGFVRGGDSKTGLRLAAFYLIYYAFLMIQTIFFGQYQTPRIIVLAISFEAGVYEEAIFRGYLVSFLLRRKNEEKYIPWILIASAVPFGLVHLLNTLAGAPVDITILQAIGSIGIGAFLAAVYIRSGNIIIVMAAHALNDIIALLDKTQMTQSGVMTATVSFINYVDIAICIGLFVLSLYLVRPAKRKEIVELWNKKWLRQEETVECK